jgi:hypothetical protein|tara:strand:+ start:1071 stop:1535 length:465 start_codon:yes stop_codon:yes gene_type:complete
MEQNMKKTLKIGWQKYEDVLESQINSPIIDQLYNSMIKRSNEYANFQELTQEELEQIEQFLEAEGATMQQQEEPVQFNIDDNLAHEISLATNFDCWVAHTNFNLTENIKNKLDSIEGIELLKVFSRYRFLVGVGKMFEFSDVRKTIEDTLTNKD